MQQNIMEKELKSCMGVLLRADLTGHGHSSPFCQNGLDGRALLCQPSKGHPCRILIIFPYCSTISLAPHIKKFETYFALLYFWTFAQCGSTVKVDQYLVEVLDIQKVQVPLNYLNDYSSKERENNVTPPRIDLLYA